MPKADFQILDAVLARVAALRIPFHRDGRVFVRAIAGDGVITIERLVLEQILFPRTSHDDQSERLVGLVHAMDRLGDFSVTKRLPLAFRNGRDRDLDRRVLICPDRKDLVGFLAIIEDIRLIRCTVGAHGLNPLALGHVAFAGLHKLQVPGRRSRIAFSEFVVDDQTVFRYMPHHRHVTLLALIPHSPDNALILATRAAIQI